MRAWILVAVAACGGSAAPPKAPQLERGSLRVPIDGVDIAVEIRGTGPVCIAHPGGPGISAEYLRMPQFEKHFTMVYVDPVGTGASGKLAATEEYSIARDVKTIEALRLKIGVDKVCLVGHSYGGFVVQSYAVEYPNHVSGLFLYSTTPMTEPEWEAEVMANTKWFAHQPFFPDAMKAFEEENNAKTEAELTAIVLREWPMYFADWTGHKAEYAALTNQVKISFEVYRRRASGKTARFDVRTRLGRLGTTPTLIVTGEKDFICGPKPAKWISERIAGSKTVIIPRAGHFAHVEQSAAFDETVDAFAALLR